LNVIEAEQLIKEGGENCVEYITKISDMLRREDHEVDCARSFELLIRAKFDVEDAVKLHLKESKVRSQRTTFFCCPYLS